MSGASEVPAIPEDVRKLAGQVVFDFLEGPTGQPQAQVLRDLIAAAIIADRLARPVDTGREKALEEATASARFARLMGIASRIIWTDLGEPAMQNAQTQTALQELSEFVLQDALEEAHRIRALANPENGRG